MKPPIARINADEFKPAGSIFHEIAQTASHSRPLSG